MYFFSSEVGFIKWDHIKNLNYKSKKNHNTFQYPYFLPPILRISSSSFSLNKLRSIVLFVKPVFSDKSLIVVLGVILRISTICMNIGLISFLTSPKKVLIG